MQKACVALVAVLLLGAATAWAAQPDPPPGPTTADAPTTADGRRPTADEGSVSAEGDRGTVLGKNLWETFQAGGALMWPILATSIIGLAFIFERAVSLREKVAVPRGIADAVVAAVRDGNVAEAQRICTRKPSALTRVLAAGLAASDRTREEVLVAMQEAGERELWHMDRFNRPLTIVVSVAPLLGLLGTVQGMIMAFDVVARKGAMGDPRQLAAGVATALLTTFAGLTVAIPCYCFYHYYRDKADRMLVQIEDAAAHLVDGLKGTARNANPTPS